MANDQQPPVSTAGCLQYHCAQCDGTDIDVTALARFRPNERWRLLGFQAESSTFNYCHTCGTYVSLKEHA